MAFPGYKRLGVRLTQTDTTAQHTLGTRVSDDVGNEYVYVQANGAIAVADIISFSASYDCAPLTGAGVAWGVANTAIADNSYGWIQVKGYVASAAVETGPADGAYLVPVTGSNGYLNDAATPGADNGLFAKQIGAQTSNKAAVFIL